MYYTVLVHVQVRTLCSTPGASDRPAAVPSATAFFSVMTARPPPARAPFPLSLLQLQACIRGFHCASCTPRRLTVMTVSILRTAACLTVCIISRSWSVHKQRGKQVHTSQQDAMEKQRARCARTWGRGHKSTTSAAPQGRAPFAPASVPDVASQHVLPPNSTLSARTHTDASR